MSLPKICRLAGLLISIFFFLPDTARGQTPNPEDVAQLLQLFDSLKGDFWSDTTYRWDLEPEPVKWKGVVWNEQGQVVTIDLDGMWDSLPSGVDNLTQGVGMPQGVPLSLPATFSLPALKVLSLGGNNAMIQLPSGLNLPELVILSLNGNKINVDDLASLFGLSNLQELYAARCELSGTLPDLQFPELRLLEMRRNNLEGTLPGLDGCPKLEFLSFRLNNFDGLVPVFQQPSLNFLYLNENAFTFEDLLPAYTALKIPKPGFFFEYLRQDSMSFPQVLTFPLGLPYTFDIKIDTAVTSNQYFWYKEGMNEPFDATVSSKLFFPTVTEKDTGIYWCHIRNAVMLEDTLESWPFQIKVCKPEVRKVDTLLCRGQSLTVRGLTYGENNRTGLQIIPQAASNGCDSAYLVQLRYREIVNLDTLVCSDEALLLQTYTPGDPAGQWSTSSGSFIETPLQNFTLVSLFDQDTNLFIWKPDTNICSEPASDTVLVVYDAPPTAQPDTFVFIAGKTAFDGEVSDNDDFQTGMDTFVLVIPADTGILEFAPNGTFIYSPQGTFMGTVHYSYAVCPLNCFPSWCDTVEVIIRVEPDATPHVITPNGDGINDTFVIKELVTRSSDWPDNQVIIVNQWGQCVLDARPYLNDWDGSTAPERLLPEATYYFIFLKNWHNKEITERGKIAVIR